MCCELLQLHGCDPHCTAKRSSERPARSLQLTTVCLEPLCTGGDPCLLPRAPPPFLPPSLPPSLSLCSLSLGHHLHACHFFVASPTRPTAYYAHGGSVCGATQQPAWRWGSCGMVGARGRGCSALGSKPSILCVCVCVCVCVNILVMRLVQSARRVLQNCMPACITI